MDRHLYRTHRSAIFQIMIITELLLGPNEARWNSNSHFSLTQNVSQILNRTDCWICTHMPEYGGKGISLIGIPIPSNHSWATLWESTTWYTGNDEVQKLEITSPKAQEPYCTCVQRCNPPKGLGKLDCVNGTYNTTESYENWKRNKIKHQFQGPACGRDGPYTPDVFFWCCILFFATFALSSFLKKFKTSRYFPTRVRSTVSDFAVFLTIVIMVLLDFVVGIPSPKLHVPHAFKPTRDDRGWFINPIGPNPWWTVLAALVPALLCTILIFMDQQISAVIVNRKEHKLKKGCGYHLDLFMVAVMLGVCSVMGLPWFVAATVLSITHVNSLKVESDCSAPGEQPKFLGIREQRVTGLLIFALMGCSVFFTSVLKFIPMPVLYGVFLYMGVSSLRGIQFFDRLKLFWMPAKHQPDFIYLRHVPLRKVHFFTAIQLICLVLLWTIKVSRAAIIFPLMVLALVFVRKAMDLCFSKRELSFLDDLMPERKKKLDDGRNEAGEEEEESQKAMEAAAAASSVQLSVGQTSDLEIPKQSSDRTDPSEIIILDEMSQTPVWKALTLKTETL
ncbi:electroneutral sodium bicarbonate exchanger 1-like [Morphnus guianensis]